MEYILLAGPIIFITVTMILGIKTPNYSHKHNFISELALGKYGKIQKINFMVSGLLISGLCFLLATRSQDIFMKLGWDLGIVVGFLLFLTGVWDTDFGKPKRTKAGKLHEFIYEKLGSPIMGVVYLLLGFGFRDRPIILVLTWLIVTLSFLIDRYSEKFNLKHGVSQRIIVFTSVIWMEFLAILTLLH